MPTFLSNVFSAASTFLGGVQTYLIVGALSGLLSAGVSGYVVYRVELSTINGLKASAAVSAQKATIVALDKQKSLDAATQAAAIAEAASQVKVETVTRVITKEIPAHVTPQQDSHECVTFGFVRVLYAAERGADPDSLALPASESDDACTAIKLSDLAASLATDYGVSLENSEQLNALIANVKQTDAISGAPPMPAQH